MITENENICIADKTDEPQTETKPKIKRKPPLPRSERLAERLKQLNEKREKAYSAQSTALQRAKEIEDEIVKVKEEIQNEEFEKFRRFCTENNLSVKDISAFITSLADKMSLADAAEILEIKYISGGDENG